MRRWVVRLPAILGAALLAFCGLQIGWNAAVGGVWPALAFHVKFPPGYVAREAVAATPANFLDGAWQRDVAARIGVQTVMYRDALRWKKQVYVSLFGMSGVSNILVGRGGELLERIYIDEYCRRDPQAMREAAGPWAARIRELQNRFEARGEKFLYLISPSKAAVHPETIPADYPCRGAARAAEKLTIYRAALQRSGVHFVDGPALMNEARRRYGMDVFAQGGSHWNAIGAAVAAQAAIGALDAQGAKLTPLAFTVSGSVEPQGWDRDLADLLNLPFKRPYRVPALSYRSTPGGACVPAHIAEIGGSFLFQFNDALGETACPPAIRPYYYWTNLTTPAPGGQFHREPEDPERRRADIIGWADIVVLEENDSLLPGSAHAKALMRLMQGDASAARP